MTEIERALIYLADDEPANRALLERILARNGFGRVRSFADGRGLLDGVGEEEPDLILLDLRMPGADGYEVLARLRDRQPPGRYLPVLVLTADAATDARDRALAGGAHDFLVKPFDALEVALRVRNLVETRLLHETLRARNLALAAEIDARTTELRATEQGWATVTAALSRIGSVDAPEASAQAICEEIASLPGLDLVSILAFGAGDATFVLGHGGSGDRWMATNQALPAAWSRWLRDRLAGSPGPWIGPPTRGPDPQAGEGPELPEEISVVALLPLATAAGPLGALVVGTGQADGVTFLGRRLVALEGFAALASAILARGITERQRNGQLRAEIARLIASRSFWTVYQPVVDLASGEVVGYEALTRFADGFRPDRRFVDAAAVGLGIELEAVALTAAIDGAGRLAADRWLSLNVSPAMITEGRRLLAVVEHAASPIVLEITEHVPIADYTAFRSAMAALGRDVRFAVDDAGAGFSSFRHILELRPDYVKLDIALVRAIEQDPARQAFVAGMVYFATRTGATLIAEGVESEAEHETLRALRVRLGQGFLLGRPSTDVATAAAPGAGIAKPAAGHAGNQILRRRVS